ncbi:MAG: VWA domain-containing protein [Bacteroidetes bacterium]|nr:VWA domain-containing protein [Bacteroidota bacterium]
MSCCKGFAAWLLLVLLFAPMAQAQFALEVENVHTDAFPDITADVVVRQSGVIVRTADSSDFTLKEDGFAQSPLHLVHPVATQNFSMTVVIAVGSTMSAGDVAFAKGLAARLVDRMDGILDEMAVLTYDGNALEQQSMTAIKPLLLSRISAIAPTGGSNYIWDGGYAGLSYLLNNSIHPVRTMVFLSNGRGDGGTRDVQQVINLAKTFGIKVHCYGINAVNNDAQMKQLCQETGGTFWGSTDLMVQQLIDELNGTPAASKLTYRSDNACRDGGDRSLFVQVKSGNDSVSTTKAFPLAADASGNVTITVKADTTSITGGNTKEIDLLFTPALLDQRLYAGSITLSFDTALLRLQSVTTDGTLAEGMGASSVMTASGADITLTGVAALEGSGALAKLTFAAAEVQANTDVQVQVTDVTSSRGCLTVQGGSARITVRPKTASMSTKTTSVVFSWNDAAKRYDPDPATVTVEVTNNGDVPLSGLTATMEPLSDVRIAYGGASTVVVQPDSLAPGEKGTATWLVQALPHATEMTAQANVVITSTEGARAQQRIFLNIKAAGSAVAMRCDADSIIVAGGNYMPDPAEVRAVITSAGMSDGPAGDVSIVLPNDITLDGGPATQAFTVMTSGSSVTLHWPLRYPRPAVRTDYPILLVRSAAGHPNDTCRVTLTVPVLTAAQLDVTCNITPNLIDSTVTEVTYTVNVRNTGNADAINVAAAVMPPVQFQLGPGEAATKAVADPLAAGQQASVSWVLVPVSGQRCADATVNVASLVSQSGGASVPCGANVTLEATGNLPAEIRSVTPSTIDTLKTGTEIAFDVDAFDAERDTLTYAWFVDGTAEGSGRSFLRTFTDEGDYTVRVDIYDRCTLGGGQPVSHTWQVFVYNTTGIEHPGLAQDLAILGNYPNPFNPGTVIEFRLPEGRHDTRLDVLDAAGQLVRCLVSRSVDGGTHRVSFNAEGLPSGSYLVRLVAGDAVRSHRMLLVK